MSIWPTVERMYGIKVRAVLNLKDVYRVRTDTATYCLKSYDLPEDEVRFIARIFSYMRDRGYSRGQIVYPTVEQSAFMTLEGMKYMLTNWVYGLRPNFAAATDFKKGIRTLAKFHAIADGFPASEAPAARIRYAGLGGEAAEYKALLAPYRRMGHLTALCDEASGYLSGPKVQEALKAEQNASAFVHGDFNYPNLVKDAKRKLHLIDFENCSLHARMKDLSHILHRNCTWNGTAMLRWIDYYQCYRPLSKPDLSLLHALLSAPYPLIRNLRIGGTRLAGRVIPTAKRLGKYRRELGALL